MSWRSSKSEAGPLFLLVFLRALSDLRGEIFICYQFYEIVLTLTLHNLDLNDSTDILDPVAFIVPMLDASRSMLDNLNSTRS